MNTRHPHPTRHLRRLAAGGIPALLLLVSCEESLPPRTAQLPRVEAAIAVVDTLVNVHTNVERRITEVVGSGGALRLTVVSHHDEVLQDHYAPAGHIDVWLKKDPSLWKRLDFTMFRFVNQGDLSVDSLLTMFPGKRIWLEFQWSHRDSAGVPFWRRGERRSVVPPIGYPYYETEPLQFVAEGTAQLFGEEGALYTGRIQFTLHYRETIIGAGDTLAGGRQRQRDVRPLELLQK